MDREEYLQLIEEAGFSGIEVKQSVVYDTLKGENYGVASLTVEAHKG
jgi:hypothetical protein